MRRPPPRPAPPAAYGSGDDLMSQMNREIEDALHGLLGEQKTCHLGEAVLGDLSRKLISHAPNLSS